MMKNLKSYKMYESSDNPSEPIRKIFTREQLSWLDKCTFGSWKYNPQTGRIDVEGDFNCSRQKLNDFKGIEFGTVDGEFNCNSNNLTSLEGSPRKVTGGFRCSWNNLKNLIGGPDEVYSGYWAQDNGLTSLKGSPAVLNCDMFLRDNDLEDLDGSPEVVMGSFICHSNKLKTLKGAPKKVADEFSCAENDLEDLVGIPSEIGDDAKFYGNKIKSLRGIDDLKNLNALKSMSSLSENPLPKKIANEIIDLMISKGIDYKDALKEIWPKLDDKIKILLYEDLPGITDQQKEGYKKLKSYLDIRDLL